MEHYGTGEAYLPVLEALGQLCRGGEGEQIIGVLRQYAPTWLVQMPALLTDAEMEAIQRKVQGATRERMLRELAEALEVLTSEMPLVLVLEDLHWSDYSTLDLIPYLARRRGPARLLVLGSYRPAEVIASGHSLLSLTQELHAHQQCADLALRLLSAGEVGQYLTARFDTMPSSNPQSPIRNRLPPSTP
ncbi:MAG: AAA family ATPase [Candidatus Binatia bacterium]